MEQFADEILQDVSRIENLPQELIWKIIEFAPESVFDLRQVGVPC